LALGSRRRGCGKGRGGANSPCSQGVSPFVGRLAPGRHPIKATARARINQFALANSIARWWAFLARPR